MGSSSNCLIGVLVKARLRAGTVVARAAAIGSFEQLEVT